MAWSISRSGKLSIKAFYSFLVLEASKAFTSKVIWNLWVLMRVSFFTWKATQGRILTFDHLKRKGVFLVTRCYMCKKKKKSIDEMLLHCVIAIILWKLVFFLFRFQWMMNSSFRLMLLSSNSIQVGKRRKRVWLATSLYLLCTISCERNQNLDLIK